MSGRLLRSFGVLVILLLGAASARAELGDDADKLVRAWQKHGSVKRLPPRFAERGSATVLFLPPEFVSASSACTSLAILGPPATHFTARTVGESAIEAGDAWPEPSLAGLIQLTRCGKRRPRLGAVLVELRSPRAVLETIVVETRVPLASAIEILPQRNPGPIEPLEARSSRASPPPVRERLEQGRARLMREGAERVSTDLLKSSRAGTGDYRRLVAEGCYRFAFFAEPPGPGEPERELELLPEKNDALSVVALETGDGFDAAVTLCTGDRTPLSIGVSGAASSAPVHVLIAESQLPRGLPEAWGSRARARVAATLFKHRVRLDGPPIDQALGVQGPTLMPLAVEPGACYVGVLVAVRGTAQALTLSGMVGHDHAANHAPPGGDGTLISLCARARTSALFETDARGSSLFWLFALFQNGRMAVGGERD